MKPGGKTAGMAAEARACDVGEAEALPFEAGSFDLVFASMVVHHIDDLTKAGIEIHQVLSPGGA